MKSDYTKAVLKRIDDERQVQGLSMKTLSVKAGLGQNFLSEALVTDKDPRFSCVIALMHATGARPDWILLGSVPGAGQDLGPAKYKETGDRLTYLRVAHSSMSAEEWAKSINIPVQTYLTYESGHKRIPVDDAQALVARLKVSLHWLYIGEPMAERDPRPDE